jgi:2-amino-4-hydroxy-6-hydroxymethyldihydropteridine diphosphokinase/dihydropteroate synthase
MQPSNSLPQLMAVLNLTPDSFSDGGKFNAPEAALKQADYLLAEGATVLDVGAESTRPGAEVLCQKVEWARLEPVLQALATHPQRRHFILSVDTRHPDTAEKSLLLGVDWINDVTGGADSRMEAVLAASNCSYVCMHALTVPVNPAITLPEEADVIATLRDWAEERLERLEKAGIASSRVILDPGIGFGKTLAQNLTLLKEPKAFLPEGAGARLLIGHSRKSFLRTFSDVPAEERDVETLAVSLYLAEKGVDYLRVHHPGWHRRAFAVWQGMRE